MEHRDGRRDHEEQVGETAEPPAPTPAVSPGSLAWASAVGNQAVARLASTQSVAREPAEEEEEAEEEVEAPAPEEAGAGAAAPAGSEPPGEAEVEASPEET